jgi:5-methylcytosine-specific restriction enzyme subunit McrC
MTDETQVEVQLVGRIPIRNLWFLMLYASDLARYKGAVRALIDQDIDDLPDLVADLLTKAVEHRLRRNLTRGYRNRVMILPRVRGCIDMLTTETRQLLARGEVACRFPDLTIDTPRNRLVRGALERMARLVRRDTLMQRCRSLALSLGRAGVNGSRFTPSELVTDPIGRNDRADHFMVALAQLAFQLALPTEDLGPTTFVSPAREEVWVRRLFEKAVLGFAQVELQPLGWHVQGSIPLHWQISVASNGLRAVLPRMITDIVLSPPLEGRRVIVDTKFASILGARRFGGDGLNSGYLYQMYAYLRSQEGIGVRSGETAGLFLHPAIGATIWEHAVIQGHSIAFATVNLAASASAIRTELINLLTRQSEASVAAPQRANVATSG